MLMRILFLASLLLVADAKTYPTAAAIYPYSPIIETAEQGLAVSANTQLQELMSTDFTSVTRLGFSAPGDGPRVIYNSTSAACTLNAGNGDNGSQVKLADGNCAVASFQGPADIRVWGAKGDCRTDNGPPLTAAMSSGIPLKAPNGNFLISTPITPTKAVHIEGAGYTLLGLSAAQSPCPTDPGTYFVVKNNATWINPINLTGVNSTGGSYFAHIAFTQQHSTNWTSWTPTPYQPVITIDGTSAPAPDYTFEDIGFAGIYAGINAINNAARISLHHIRGQTFSYLFHADGGYDIDSIDDVWDDVNYWSNNPNVVAWQQANSDLIYLGRQDSLLGGSVFAFGKRSCVRLTSTGNGGPTGIRFGYLNCDAAKYSVWADSEASGGNIKIDEIWAGGETLSGTPIVGSNVIAVDGKAFIVEVGFVNAMAISGSVVSLTNPIIGSVVHIGKISGGGNGWNYNSSSATFYTGNSPTIYAYPASSGVDVISIDSPVQPQNAGANYNNLGVEFTTGLINHDTNALLYNGGFTGQAWDIYIPANGRRLTWPSYAETLLFNNDNAINSFTLTMPIALDGRTVRLVCGSPITRLTISSNAPIIGAPTSCGPGKSYSAKYILGVNAWFFGG